MLTEDENDVVEKNDEVIEPSDKGGDVEMQSVAKTPDYMQQIPSEDGSDLINRANAIKEICNAQCELDVPHYPQCDQVKYCDEIKALLALPSVDRPQGEWKHTITWQPYCSNCEYVFDEDEEYSPFWKFCPMCGARMENTK